jgi:uncharacterized protein (DUF1330 family)
MKNIYGVSLALLAGFGLGAVSMRVVHAQSKPPAYVIDQIEVSNLDAYIKEFGPLASKAIEAGGGKYMARGGKTAEIDGEAPKGRVVLIAFESLEQAQAAFSSPAMQEARKIGDKYAKFRTFAVEGLPK